MSLTAVVIAAVGFTCGETVAMVIAVSTRQTLSPAPILGRVTAAYWTVNDAFGPIGAATLTAWVHVDGVQRPMYGVAAVCFVFVVAGLFSPLRRTRVDQGV